MRNRIQLFFHLETISVHINILHLKFLMIYHLILVSKLIEIFVFKDKQKYYKNFG